MALHDKLFITRRARLYGRSSLVVGSGPLRLHHLHGLSLLLLRELHLLACTCRRLHRSCCSRVAGTLQLHLLLHGKQLRLDFKVALLALHALNLLRRSLLDLLHLHFHLLLLD